MKQTAFITASVIVGLTLATAVLAGAILTLEEKILQPAPAVAAPKPLPQLPHWFLGEEDKARLNRPRKLETKPAPKPPERIRPRPYHWHEV